MAASDYKVDNLGRIFGYDLIVKGPWVDARAYATLELANTAAYNAGKTLLIAQNYTLTANTTLTAAVKAIKGGSFTKASTYTLAINGPPEIGFYQVFSGFSAGDVTFGAGAVKEVYPQWWQVNTTPGTTDMTVAIQAAINTNLSVYIPSGNYLISAALTNTANNMIIRGEGKSSKIFTTTLGIRIFNISSCNNLTIEGLYLFGTTSEAGAYPAQDGIKLTNVTKSTIKNNVLENFRGSGILLYAGCDDNLITGNEIINTRNAGIHLAASSNYNRITENLIYNGDKQGIHILDTDTRLTVQQHNIISNNIIRDTGTSTSQDHAIYIAGKAYNTVISGNSIYNPAAQGIQVNDDTGYSPDNTTITGNVINTTGSYGIYFDAEHIVISGNILKATGGTPGAAAIICAGNMFSVSGNTIIDPPAKGIWVTANYGSISGNTIIRSAFQHIHLDSAAYISVTGNNLTNGDAIDAGYYHIELGGAACGYNTIIGNTLTLSNGATYHSMGIKLAATIILPNYIIGNTLNAVELSVGIDDGGTVKAVLAFNFTDTADPWASGKGIRNLVWNATAAVGDGGTITHGLGATPAAVIAIGSIAGEFVSVTAIGATDFTVAIKTHAGEAGTSQTIYWITLI